MDLIYFREYQVQITWVRSSSTPKSSAPVKIMALIFSLIDLTSTTPVTMVTKPPVCLLIFFYTANDASMYHFMFQDFYIEIINGDLYIIHQFWQIIVITSIRLSLYCIEMILQALCLDGIYLTITIVLPQSDEKGLCRFRIVWLHRSQN